MATNEIFTNGEEVSKPVGTGVKSGDPLRIGIRNYVATTDGATNNAYGYASNDNLLVSGNEANYASTKNKGYWKIPVTTSAARAIDTPLYCVATGGTAKVTLTDDAASGANKLWGTLADATSGAVSAVVRGVNIIPFSV